MTKEQFISKEASSLKATIEQIHKMASTPEPLQMDEIAMAWLISQRVNAWKNLGEKFGGVKVGAIYLYLIDLVGKQIHNSINFPQEVEFKKWAK